MALRKRFEYAFRQSKRPLEHITAVHDDDLEDFLASIGILNKIKSGKVHCKFCKDVIDIRNLQSVFPDSGSIGVVCNKEYCIRMFLDYLRGQDG